MHFRVFGCGAMPTLIGIVLNLKMPRTVIYFFCSFCAVRSGRHFQRMRMAILNSILLLVFYAGGHWCLSKKNLKVCTLIIILFFICHTTRTIIIGFHAKYKWIGQTSLTIITKLLGHNFNVCCTAITKGKTPVPVCSPQLSPVGQG